MFVTHFHKGNDMSVKPVNWGLIEYGDELYAFTNGILEKYHGNIKEEQGQEQPDENSETSEDVQSDKCLANIVLMWRYNVKPDQDGYIMLATISKSSDQVRELHPHDFVIGINKDAWSVLDEQQRTVVIDAQLERIAVCLDKEGNPREDDRSRTIYRLKKTQAVDEQILQRRHGMSLHDVQEFVFNKLERAGAEAGSYVDQILSE